MTSSLLNFDPAWQRILEHFGLSTERLRLETATQRLYDLLIEANQTTNLTRITSPEDFLTRHILDSLSLSPLIAQGAVCLDVGTGAGFPALPLAMARSDLKITALDSVAKKCRFIEGVKETLALENLSVLVGRSEDLAKKPPCREAFDCVLSRAVAPMPVLLELTLPFVKPGGLFLAMKGEQLEKELLEAVNALKILGGEQVSIERFTDLGSLSASQIAVIRKAAKTPAMYPRMAGTPKRKPL